MLEVVAATAVIGVAVEALPASVQAGTQVNSAGRRITQAAALVDEIREWTPKLPFSDPDPADQRTSSGPDGAGPQAFVDGPGDPLGVSCGPPRDANSLPTTDMATRSQHSKLAWRYRDNLKTIVASGSTDVLHAEVGITCPGEAVLATGWLIASRK